MRDTTLRFKELRLSNIRHERDPLSVLLNHLVTIHFTLHLHRLQFIELFHSKRLPLDHDARFFFQLNLASLAYLVNQFWVI